MKSTLNGATALLAAVLASLATQAAAATQPSSSTSSLSARAGQPSCSSTVGGSSSTPVINPDYRYRVVASGLTKPRGMQFDSAGNLLVVQQGVGIVALRLGGTGSCLTADKGTTVVSNSDLNHGIAFSPDGKTLYASSSEALYSWSYDSQTRKTTSRSTTLVTGMANSDHTTRTLLVPNNASGLILISRGSTSNVDDQALELSSGHSQIKAFNLTNLTSSRYDFNTDGLRLGWGLRNSVGVGQHPVTGGIYSVENNVDDLHRNGVDLHENNPGEEMNFHGYLNGTAYAAQGGNYGYPSCLPAWDPAAIPNNTGITVGTQFSFDGSDATDAQCRDDHVAPRLVFQAHMAPLDIKFNRAGSAAYVTFHGSWDRSEPSGYKLSVVAFDPQTGSPLAPSTSNASYVDILRNADNSKCPDACFRPVGLAWSSGGALFMSSDASGEVYMVVRTDGGRADGALPSGVAQQAQAQATGASATTTTTTSGGSGSSTSTTGAAPASSSSSGAAHVVVPPLVGWITAPWW